MTLLQRSPQFFFLFVVLLFFNCLPSAFSGASAPTAHTFELTPHDVEVANNWTKQCEQSWVTGDAEKDLKIAKAELSRHNVKIRVGNPGASGTALRRTLLIAKEFQNASATDQVRLFSHELVHYCQREKIGHAAFEELYTHSAGRWRIEVPAYAQTFRTLLIYGTDADQVNQAVEARLSSMRNTYWLYDIAPDNYGAETLRIWDNILKQHTKSP